MLTSSDDHSTDPDHFRRFHRSEYVDVAARLTNIKVFNAFTGRNGWILFENNPLFRGKLNFKSKYVDHWYFLGE